MHKRSKQRSVFSSLHSSSLSSSRSGMELAIGTLVVMILGVIIVGGGILLIKMITDKSINLNDNLNSDVQRQLQDATLRGQLVGIAPSSQISYGAKDAVFGIRVVNRDFSDEVNFNVNAIHAENNLAQNNWSIQFFHSLKVPAHDRKDAMVVVGALKGKQVPAGTYTFIVNITYIDSNGDEKVYDAPRFFTVLVK